MHLKKNFLGFTLMKVLISLAIVAILVVTTIHLYQKHVRNAYFAEITNAIAPYKIAVAECAHNLGTASGCNAGSNGIPAALGASGNIASITVTDGVITVTPLAKHGMTAADTYVETPTSTAGMITWTASGGP